MKYGIAFGVLLVFIVSCSGYRGQSKKRSPEEFQMAALASELSEKADELQKRIPTDLAPRMGEFVETSHRLDNASQRFGPNSLEARDAYDKLRYHAKRLDEQITKQSHPGIFDDWQSIQNDYVTKIGVLLGYRMKEKG